MSTFIAGTGWITPQGAGLDEVWNAVLAGLAAPAQELAGPAGQRSHFRAPVPPALVEALARQPRLRRSSSISYFAAAAGLAALREAGYEPAWNNRCALIFAIGSGGVIYTRKFYDQVVREGTGSPLLFPETVYNAPASHLAALMGLTGLSYTLVGDATVGLSALNFGRQLLRSGEADHCLIVGAEEVDWVLCEAYRAWRLAAAEPRIEIGSRKGMLLGDGAAAVVLSRAGPVRVDEVSDGVPFFRRAQAGARLRQALEELSERSLEPPSLVISSANGTFVDLAERAAVKSVFGELPAIFPKVSLGEALGAGALQQLVCGVQALRRGHEESVLVPVLGLNHQAAAALISDATPVSPC